MKAPRRWPNSSDSISVGEADVDADRLTYAHGGSLTEGDEFTFTVSDAKGAAIGPFVFEIIVTLVTFRRPGDGTGREDPGAALSGEPDGAGLTRSA